MDEVERDPYAVEHIREILAQDPRVSELELQVDVVGSRIFVSGVVPTDERREAISRALAEALPGAEVHNATTVAVQSDAIEVEELP